IEVAQCRSAVPFGPELRRKRALQSQSANPLGGLTNWILHSDPANNSFERSDSSETLWRHRACHLLADGRATLEHEVVLFASGDSESSAQLEACWPKALRL